MTLDEVTPLILTYNEAPNIGDTLERLRWAKRVIVIDSYSTDDTVEIAERFPNVTVIQRPFDDHVAQWNFGLEQIETGWVLTLDADYRCPSTLAEEIRSLSDDRDVYVAKITYCINGQPLRGSLYPPRAVLFRPSRCRYVHDGHTQLLAHDPARTGQLNSKILHDDRKPLSHWFAAQTTYSWLESEKLLHTPMSQLSWEDRLRRCVVFIPPLTFIYCLFIKRLVLDGRAGLYYTLQRVYTELVLGLILVHRWLGMSEKSTASATARESMATTCSSPAAKYQAAHYQAAQSDG